MRKSRHRFRSARLLRYAFRQWRALAAILALTAGTSVVTALQPWPMKLLVDAALGSGAVPAPVRSLLASLSLDATRPVLIVVAAAGSMGVFALSSALEVALGWAWAATGQRMVYDLAADLFHRLQRLSLLFHSRHSVGDALSRLTGDTWQVYTVTSGLLIAPAQHLLTLAAVGGVAWRMDAGLTAIVLGTIPVLVGSSFFFGHRLKRRARQGRELHSRLTSFVHQTLTSVPVVQAFGAEERNGHQFRQLADSAVALARRGSLLDSSYGILNGLAMRCGTAVILYLGGLRVLSGALSLGSLLVFVAYVRSIEGAMQGLARSYVTWKTGEAATERVLEVLEAEEEVRDAPGAPPLPPHAPGQRGHIRLEHVTFGYLPGRPVLSRLSLEAFPGETLALVGPTGAGKSTLVSLIPRFFDPWEGRVLFDGHDVRAVQVQSLRAQVAVVLQEPFLLPLTVAQNIAYGRPEATPEEIEAAARAANAHDFIARLPRGYETVIGERGATLSGGERQRVAIARALLKDAPVLILDEPTSALDAGTEAGVLEALERLRAGRTTFLIAHRLSTVRQAERVVVVEGGRIVEAGSHQELLAAGGPFARLYRLQFGREGSVEMLSTGRSA